MLKSLLRVPVALALFSPALFSPSLHAQSLPFTLDNVLSKGRAFIPRLPTVAWITGTEDFSMIRDDAEEQTVLRMSAQRAGVQGQIFDSGDLAAAFELDAIKPQRLPAFSWLDADTIRVVAEHAVWHWNLNKPAPERVLALPKEAGAQALTADDRRAAFVLDDDLWFADADGTRRRLTWDGSAEDVVYGGAAHRAEFGITNGLWWDRAGEQLAFYREDMRGIAAFPYVDFSVQPAARKHGRYPMAGQTHSSVSVMVFDRRDGSMRTLAHDPAADIYKTNVTWSPDGSSIYIAEVARSQDRMELVRYDAKTGARDAVLFSEADSEWIEPEMGPIFLPDDPAGRFLWFSPRDGYRNLWLYAAQGRVERQLTAAPFDLRSFGGFSADGSACYVTGSGPSGDDTGPLTMHLWRVALADGTMTRITQGAGRHQAMISDDDHVLDAASSSEDPGTLTLLRHDAPPRVITRAADPLAGADIGQGRFFEVKTEDGTTLHGYLLTPPGFDPQQRYPLIHYVYGGPHSQLVVDRPGHGANLWLRYMASQGFCVSCVDNRGTDNRGIEFSQAIHRRLGALEVRDQVAAIEQLCGTGFIDRDRIGVHGWSYGGYMTLNLMLRAPDLFAAGVSGAPVTDWSRYETGYGERYMDTPAENPEGYAETGVLHLVENLKGRLLLITPTDDHTVMPSHSVAFLDACIDKGVLIDHMAYPMQLHGLRGKDRTHFYRLMTRHFREHLGMPEPGRNAR